MFFMKPGELLPKTTSRNYKKTCLKEFRLRLTFKLEMIKLVVLPGVTTGKKLALLYCKLLLVNIFYPLFKSFEPSS